ncbi:hypothetical protein ACFWQL_35295 [Amycolatopsis thermoflava]|uniref:hypothetical protein n=1 Tax=Amycolatopsis thermoflava TaxID=84480 RepID=UPI00364BFC91
MSTRPAGVRITGVQPPVDHDRIASAQPVRGRYRHPAAAHHRAEKRLPGTHSCLFRSNRRSSLRTQKIASSCRSCPTRLTVMSLVTVPTRVTIVSPIAIAALLLTRRHRLGTKSAPETSDWERESENGRNLWMVSGRVDNSPG